MKVLKLDDKMKAINIGDGGERCQAVAEEMGNGCTQLMKIVLFVIFLPVVMLLLFTFIVDEII
jgi:hypothetical protein